MKIGMGVYIKGTLDAVEFYNNAFDTRLGYNEKNSDGTYMHATFMSDDKEIFSISENYHDIVTGNTMQLYISFDCDKDKVAKAYNVLKEECIEIKTPLDTFFWGSFGFDLIDKYGVHWYISDK